MTVPTIHVTKEQIASFNEDGFLIVENLIDENLVHRLVDRMDPLFAGEFETGVYPDEWHWNPYLGRPGASGQITGVWKSDRTIASVTLSSVLGQITAALSGWSGTRLLADGLWLKPYGAKETTLHQDSMYSFYYTPQEIVTVWIALSDAVHGAAPIEYVRGSHKWGLSETISGFHNIDQSYRWEMEQAAKRAGVKHPEILQLELKPGSCAFHHGHMWHGSGKNTLPDKVRRSMVVVCIPAESRFKPADSYVPGGYTAGRYKRHGDETMDESFFPITWTAEGYRTPFLNSYCDDALKRELAVSY